MKRIFLYIFWSITLVGMTHKRKVDDPESPPVSSPSPTQANTPIQHPKFICKVPTYRSPHYRSPRYCGSCLPSEDDLKRHLRVNHLYTQQKLKEYISIYLHQG